MEIKGGVNNMTWQPDIAGAHGIFDPYMFIIGNLSLRNELSKAWSFDLSLERDNLLWNSLNFRLKTRADNFAFDFGVFTGINDDFSSLDIGISGSMEVTWPGIMFFSLGGSSTIGTLLDFTGDNGREKYEARIGCWLPFAIPVFTINRKIYNENTKEITTVTSLIRYELSIEFFGKTSPVTLQILGGYQNFFRTYGEKSPVYPIDEVNSFFAGIDFQFSVSKQLRFIIGGEMPYIFEYAPQMTLQHELLSMKIYGGVVIKFF